jgi:hypothetical protein
VSRAFPSLVQVLFVSTLADLRRSRQRSRESHHAKQLPSLVNRSNGTPLFIGVQSCRYGLFANSVFLFANNLRLDNSEEGLKNPTAEEWAAFAASCNLRDMGTHLCALPTGEHCPKGLICLGCANAQPKKSAVPIFRRMLTSHERSLATARGHSEPAGQIAAREMEIVRIKGALQRAEELSDDVASAIERAS